MGKFIASMEAMLSFMTRSARFMMKVMRFLMNQLDSDGFEAGSVSEGELPMPLKQGTQLIGRNARRFYEERGWRQKGTTLHGWYRTRYKSFEGKIEKPFSKKPGYYILKPPAELLQGPHGACFKQIKKDVFTIHWAKKPDTVNTGIQRVEHILYEAYHETAK